MFCSDWARDPYMPKSVLGGEFEKKMSDDSETGYLPARPSSMAASHGRDSFQLVGRVNTQQSMTHDMATGSVRHGPGRGYGFDQADDMLPANIRRYTSRSPFTLA